jgi:GxxExxY protein
MNENAIGKEVVDAAVKVHRELGPGLLETVYEVVLARELEKRGLGVERQVPVPIVSGGQFDNDLALHDEVGPKALLEAQTGGLTPWTPECR